MKMFSDCSGDCWYCKSGSSGCLAGHGDDDFIPASKEQLIYRLDSNQYRLYRSDIIKMLKEKFNYDYTDEVGKERLLMRTVYDMIHDIMKSRWHITSDMPFGFDNYAILGERDITLSLTPQRESSMHVYSFSAGYIVFDITIIDYDGGDEYIRLNSATNEGQYVYAELNCELYRPIKSCFDEFLKLYLDSCSDPMDKYAVNMKRVCEEFPAFLYNFIVYNRGVK